jgi:hypothetical protein
MILAIAGKIINYFRTKNYFYLAEIIPRLWLALYYLFVANNSGIDHAFRANLLRFGLFLLIVIELLVSLSLSVERHIKNVAVSKFCKRFHAGAIVDQGI